ncbi:MULTISPECIES: hypothetical protein [Pyrobaculum]|uniref:Uncharacterized protein n=2 Tax=Pyrobaculum arsenaticum TaxID=121277 RepID=A4WKC4_PYRAR|nr:hypothetical protein [Pyrobaculum arsenaticum]ABP50841.1 hypothetical protein Pars_1277 [Pyrobaculum arsenaticum DSM 13514]MCY0891374.1 hypothetical protein [Pyrobaculum arsenaticum]NYR15439.1 hypothetical protein [Pyrobaculum arsenaticum]
MGYEKFLKGEWLYGPKAEPEGLVIKKIKLVYYADLPGGESYLPPAYRFECEHIAKTGNKTRLFVLVPATK